MKQKIVFTIGLFLFSLFSYALDISAGKFYYDNSKTRWVNVQFLYGTDYPGQYTIISLTHLKDDIWELTIPTAVYNSYRYSFCNTTFTDGTYTDMTFTEIKDYIGWNYARTATVDTYMPPGGTYKTESGENWTQGWWSMDLQPSGTLPVFYLNTDNGAEITTKEYYVGATLYIDALGLPGFSSLGTAENPIVTEARGRGNYTWNSFVKKPYRIKMEKKNALLNMSRDKSYALLAHADDPGFLRNAVGFELSRRLGMKYTTQHEPIELIKNGEYRGLYFLTEHIKVSSERVNITEQDDYETDPFRITGGWLMEIDNYYETNQVSTYRVPRFTYKSPDYLSYQQENYIRSYLQKVEDAIYSYNKNSTEWEKYIDLETFINFYIVQEIMGNTESFHGSCFFSKDRGEDEKIFFGPVWDFGNAYRHENYFVYENIEMMFSSNWLPEIALYPHFQDEVRRRWTEIREPALSTLYDYIDGYVSYIREAVRADFNKWREYGYASYDYEQEVEQTKNYLRRRIAWLDEQWLLPTGTREVKSNFHVHINPVSGIIYMDAPSPITEVRLYNTVGQLLSVYKEVGNTLIPEVENGAYIIQIQTNGEVFTKKILIQKK
ncbi:MAG: CotH kinase family protein [Candidatus Azobacteroides sp.]|nr:CotH kinase family protein [Candidatus Azobacteroides sp.]